MEIIESHEQLNIRTYANLYEGGHLSLLHTIDKPFRTFERDTHQEARDYFEYVKDVKKLILRRNRERLKFCYKRTIYGRNPVRCFPFSTPKDRSKSAEFIKMLLTLENDSKLRSFAPKRTIEEIFDIEKDPETLNDSEMDSLLNNDEQKTVCDTFIAKNENLDMTHSFILASCNSLYMVGDPEPIRILDNIMDCEVFEVLPGTTKSYVLLTTNTGYLYNLFIGDSLEKVYCLQSLELGSDGSWNIIQHNYSHQFIAINKEKGVCKFFTFENITRFELVNNLIIDEAYIIDYVFLPNRSNSHLLLFIPALRYDRLVYFCVEWDAQTPIEKQVYHLPYLISEKPERCIPIGYQKCLVFFHDEFHLVSVNQIMSGETNFQKFKIMALKGASSFFDAPILLGKLKKINENSFENFTYCTIISTNTGNIIICLTDDNDNVQFYSLTRFKGLKSICSVKNQPDQLDEYNIIIISFARTIELTIDIKGLDLLKSNSVVPSLHGIVMKHTIDSSTDQATELMIIQPPKSNSRFPTELWTTSPVALTNIRWQCPIQKLKSVCALSEFQDYNSFSVYEFTEVGGFLTTKLFGEDIIGDHEGYLLFGTDGSIISRAYLLDMTIENPKLIELDDLLCGKDGCTLNVFFPQKNTMLQVTEYSIYLERYEQNLSVPPRQISPGWKIEGALSYHDKVFVWNASEGYFSYIDNISDDISEFHFRRNLLIEEKMKEGGANIEFLLADANGLCLFMATGKCLLCFKWIDIITENKMPKCDIIYPFKCWSLQNLSSQLFFIGHDYQVRLVDLEKRIERKIDMYYGKKDLQIRELDAGNGLLFSTQEVSVLCAQCNNCQPKFFDIKLPYCSKFNPVLDVHADNSKQRIFVLFGNGLQIFDMSYLSWNYSNYLLRATKQENKKTVYVQKLNRMLVINFQSREWDCLKLSDGKILALNPSVLEDSNSNPLLDVVEIPNPTRATSLVIHFKLYLKLVYLIPHHGRIIIEEKTRQKLNDTSYRDILTNDKGEFFQLQIGFPNSETDIQEVKIQRFQLVENSRINIMSSLTFGMSSKNKIEEFKICGDNDIIIKSSIHDKIFFLKDVALMSSAHIATIIPINNPPASRVVKVCPLNSDSFVIIYHCEERSDHITELHFYHTDDMIFKDPNSSFKISKSTDIFEESIRAANSSKQSQVTTSTERERHISTSDNSHLTTENLLDVAENAQDSVPSSQASTVPFFESDLDIDMDEMDEVEAFNIQPPTPLYNNNGQNTRPSIEPSPDPLQNRSFVVDTHISALMDAMSGEELLHYQAGKPYTSINLDKLAKDVKYDSLMEALYVLTTDGSVIVFTANKNTDETESAYRIYNSGYKIQTFKPQQHSHTGPHVFDGYGPVT